MKGIHVTFQDVQILLLIIPNEKKKTSSINIFQQNGEVGTASIISFSNLPMKV